MSQKAPLPSLTGHRLKTRKRDEKKQYDPTGNNEQFIYSIKNHNFIICNIVTLACFSLFCWIRLVIDIEFLMGYFKFVL